MVKEQNSEIILDNDVHVTPIFNNFCPKCKKNLSKNQYCYECSSFSYEFIINLGYYTPRWYYKNDAYMEQSVQRTNDLLKINPKYRFCKLINDAKARYTENTTLDKKNIIEILCSGFIWKTKKYDSWIQNEIDLVIHVPKENEKPQKDEIDRAFFNHGYYYALFVAKGLRIAFDPGVIKENEYSRKDSRSFSIINPERIQNKSIMIVDDVYTNGHTKGLISSLLIENRALKVYIGVIARTIA